MLRLFLFLATILVVRGQTESIESTAVLKCTHFVAPLPSRVHIKGCKTPPCELPQSEQAELNMYFEAPRAITTLTAAATAYVGILPLPVPFPLGSSAQACNSILNTVCPLALGTSIHYRFRIFMEPSVMLLNTRANVEFRMVDHNNTAVVCIDVPFHIVPARNSTTLE